MALLFALVVVLCWTGGVNGSRSSSFWSFVRGGGSIAVDSLSRPSQDLYYTQELVVTTTTLQDDGDRKHRGERKHTSSTATTKLMGIIQGFQQLGMAATSSSSSPRRRTPGSAAAAAAADIHVGKLLAAFRGMKIFLDDTGMSQVAKTLSTNIAKLETLYYKVPIQQRDSLLALLQYEIDTGIHDVNKLQDNSGAMGLVWLARNLSYQRDLYLLLLEDPTRQPLEAAQLAFERHLRPHLHWTVAKVLQAAIRSLTPATRSTFFATIGGFQEGDSTYSYDNSATHRDLQQITHLWEPLLDQLRQVLAELDQLPRGLL